MALRPAARLLFAPVNYTSMFNDFGTADASWAPCPTLRGVVRVRAEAWTARRLDTGGVSGHHTTARSTFLPVVMRHRHQLTSRRFVPSPPPRAAVVRSMHASLRAPRRTPAGRGSGSRTRSTCTSTTASSRRV
jgi:hypothetical protein